MFLAGISNFYFFYILALLVIVYTFIRLSFLYGKKVKQIVGMLVRIGAASLLGTGMAAVIVVPMLYVFMNNARTGSANNIQHLFYPMTYYSQLLSAFLSKDSAYSLYLGFPAPILLAVFLIFRRKKQHALLCSLFAIGMIFILFPIFGQVFNGLSYMCNRWSFAFALLMSYILTVMWPSLMAVKEKEKLFMFCGLTVYFGLCMLLEYSRTVHVFSAIIIGYLFLFMVGDTVSGNPGLSVRQKNTVALGIVMTGVFSLSFWWYAPANGAGYAATEGIEAKDAGWTDIRENETILVEEQAKQDEIQDFYRYSGSALTANAGVIAGISSTQFYWSLSNPNITQYRNEMGLSETAQPFSYAGYDERPALMSLASVLYYVCPWASAPYGYSMIGDAYNVKSSDTDSAQMALKKELNVSELSDDQLKRIYGETAAFWYIFQNEYALPLSYAYDTYMPYTEWSQLSATEKQEVILQSVVVDAQPGMIPIDNGDMLSTREIPYRMTANDGGVVIQDNTFVVTWAGSSVTLEFEGLADSETYFEITGLEFHGVSDYELYFGDDAVDPNRLFNRTDLALHSYAELQQTRKNRIFWKEPEDTTLGVSASNGAYRSINYKTPDFTWYYDRHNFSAFLYYSEEPITSLTVSFQNPGTYTYDDIAVFCQPMDKFADRIESLRQNTLQNMEMGTDEIRGDITLDTPKMLCLSIPYSIGWKAYVDGTETELYQANTAYMAIELEEGTHEVRLVYDTPYLREGIIISFGSMLILLIYLWRERSVKKKIYSLRESS